MAETGAFTLFASRTPWSYYARPALSHPQAVTAADVAMLRDACAARQVDLAIEWVHEIHPELAGLAANFGLEVTHHALMMLAAGDLMPATATDVEVRVVDSDDPAMPQAQAVATVSFCAGGTATGTAGAADRELAARGLGQDWRRTYGVEPFGV